MAQQIAGQAAAGLTRFDIDIDGTDLGRIEVRLEIGEDGKARAHIVVERKDTLDLMTRDQRQLDQALRTAGLDTGDDGLSFAMRDDRGSGNGEARQDQRETPSQGQTPAVVEDTDLSVQLAAAAYSGRPSSRLDLRV
ncbi:Flagellar hook-length control protein FliK [Methylobrevis pamukkalensis]|uniref:Flagellar hook-length control protein FliK n=2 Tax=Methylobrevis pamukkalensis TaxID=1439726 RepID=A0A1E3H1R8_9HYPH|nr:Flagellar hook-length control protein FliK [Methylobrevis pamukkalensis]